MSNLSFISKVVYFQFLNHITANKLIDNFQPGHNTETSILRVVHDMFNTIDNGNLSLLTMLDLSAAFDSIDHSILLERLHRAFAINGLPLKWVKFYLSDRYQKVKIDKTFLMNINVLPILYGVPLGSLPGLYSFQCT